MELILERKTIFRIIKHKKKLERALKVKIKILKGKIEFFGEGDKEFIADKVFQALDVGFSLDNSLLLIREDFIFEKVPIKSFTRSKNLHNIRARIIGTKGKTLHLLSKLSNCFLELKDNDVYIIGEAEDIRSCLTSLKSLVGGAKQGHVYGYLERARVRKRDENLGLR